MIDLYLVWYIMWMIVWAFYIYMNRQRSIFYGNLARQYEAEIARYPIYGDEIDKVEHGTLAQ